MICFSLRALKHLQQIRSFIDRDKPDASARVIEALLRSIENLVAYPKMGRSGRRKGTRELLHTPYVIVYRVRDDAIEVVAVLHGRQNLV